MRRSRIERATRLAPLALAAAWAALAAPSAFAFGAPIDASTSDGPATAGPAVAAGASGGATVAWRRAADGRIVARHVGADGSLGPVVPVSDPGDTASDAQPAAALAGTSAAIGWVRQSDAHLLVRRLDADGSLGPTWDVSGTSLSLVNGQAAVAANASGRVAVAWRRGNDSHVFFRGFDIASGPSVGAADLTADPDIALFGTNVQVAVDPSGVGVVVWHRNTDCHIIGRRVATDGTPGAQQDISGQADNAVGDTNPGVTADSSGDEIFAWHRDGDSHDKHAVTRRWRADLSLDGIQSLSSDADIPSMASFGTAAPPGAAAVAWQRESDKHILAATAAPSSVTATVDVSGAASANATAPAAATTGDGGLAVGWKAADGHLAVAFEAGTGVPPGSGGGANPGTGPRPGNETGGQPGQGTTSASNAGAGFGSGAGGAGFPIPTVAAEPALTLPRSVTVRRGQVKLPLTCASASACTGTIELFAPRLLSSGSKARRVLLARARIGLGAGDHRTITLRISRRVLRSLRDKRTHRAILVVRLVTGAGTVERSAAVGLSVR
jgi:hypothetical protein